MRDLDDLSSHIDDPGRPGDFEMAELAGRQHGRVAAWQLYPLGFSKTMISDRSAAGRLHRVFPGVYAVGHRVATLKARWMAAVLACGPGRRPKS